jgi:hypothetical protein
VTASALESGAAVTAAFDGTLLSRPSGPARPVKQALLVEYFGVYSSPLLPLLNGDPSRAAQPLQYKIVRASTVTAELVGPDGVPRVLENAVARAPGTYPLAFDTYDVEGAWHWHVEAKDDLGRPSVTDQVFRYDRTLTGVSVSGRGTATVRFTVTRAAKVRLRIETTAGIVVKALPVASLPVGVQRLAWDGLVPQGTRAYGGSFVAHLFVTSAVGASELTLPFTYQR